MSLMRCALIVGVFMLVASHPVTAQFSPGGVDSRRQTIEKIPATELLPKPPAIKPWRPVFTLDDVPEVSFEELLADCVHEQRAEQHILDTLEKIRRLDRERPKGFIAALRKHRPDLAGLPFIEGRETDMDVTLRQLLEIQRLRITPNPPATPTLLAMTVPELLATNGRSRADRKTVRPENELRAFGYFARHKMFPSDTDGRLELVHFVQGLPTRWISEELVKIAVFAPEAVVREAAIEALKTRRKIDGGSIVKYLRYPLPAVVANAIEAIVELELDDEETLQQLVTLLHSENPQEPGLSIDFRMTSDPASDLPKVMIVSEVVKINHHRNCMLCHPPANNEMFGTGGQLAASVPNPRRKLAGDTKVVTIGYGSDSVNDAILFDITYLRPDFSLTLPVEPKAHAGVWPKEQRFDFFVRERVLTKQEHEAYLRAKDFLPRSETKKLAIRALAQLTGMNDVAPTEEAWEKAIRDYVEAEHADIEEFRRASLEK